jgi:hypothetical protein
MEESKLELFDEPFRGLLRQLISRCEKVGIEYELRGIRPKDSHIRFLKILFPAGRDERAILIFTVEGAQKLNEIEFEKYTFLSGYQAICSYQDNTIEAYIKLYRSQWADFLFYKLLGVPLLEIKGMKKDDLSFEVRRQVHGKTPIVIDLSKPTEAILALSGRKPDEGADLTIKIRGLIVSNNQEATTALEKVANSLFFEIRNAIGIPLMLEFYREPWSYPRLPILETRAKESPVVFPKYQYDTEPLNLYWYATNACEMPLLQFLAYYQVLEFYFPIYSGREVQAELTNILKDPQFNPDYHLDINKIISTVQARLGRGYGDERAQLRATIKGCVQNTEVSELLERDNIKEHFKIAYKKLSAVKVSIENKDLDLREQLAERLYDIRCKIVHTKVDEAEKGRILPFTKEETLLMDEVEVIEFIARKAIIAGSKKLVI